MFANCQLVGAILDKDFYFTVVTWLVQLGEEKASSRGGAAEREVLISSLL